MADDEQRYFVGQTGRIRFRALAIDPVTLVRSPELNLPAANLRVRRPDGTVLATRTMISGITNDGQGYYHGDFIFDIEGLHSYEIETGTTIAGREKGSFNVEPF